MFSIIFDIFRKGKRGGGLPPPSDRELEYISDLRKAFTALSPIQPATESAAAAAWAKNMNRLRELVVNANPREFLDWDVIKNTMFIGEGRFIRHELDYLTRQPNWSSRWRRAIEESCVGNPARYRRYSASSTNLIQHAYHIARYEEITGTRIEDIDMVFEFGGGYGSMCRLCHNLGFRGQYIIHDLPAFSLLQMYYLKASGFCVKPPADVFSSGNGIACVSNIEDVIREIATRAEKCNSLYLATWSISETSMDFRTSMLEHIKKFKHFLIGYQDKFEEVDNIRFFEDWKRNYPQINWHSEPLSFLPGNNYLFGKLSSGEPTSNE